MSSNLRVFSLTSDSSKENSMENSILNNIQTENTWIDVETLAKLKGVTKRAVRISINKYEYRTENTRGGKSYKIKLSSLEEIQKQITRLSKRIDNLYADKLDGNVTEEYWKEKHNLWYREKEELIEKSHALNNAAKNFDEGSNLLENFCKHAPQEYLKANKKEKQQILKMLGSNFTYCPN